MNSEGWDEWEMRMYDPSFDAKKLEQGAIKDIKWAKIDGDVLRLKWTESELLTWYKVGCDSIQHSTFDRKIARTPVLSRRKFVDLAWSCGLNTKFYYLYFVWNWDSCCSNDAKVG